MSPYEINLSDFVYIIKTQPALLSVEDWISLEELLPTVPDDLEQLSNAITNWYSDRQAIVNAILELPIEEAPDRAIEGRTTNLNARKFKKEIVENDVRQQKPPSDSSPKSQPKK